MYYTYNSISLGWILLGIGLTIVFIALLLGALVVLSNRKLSTISVIIALILSGFLLFENIRMCNAFGTLKDLNRITMSEEFQKALVGQKSINNVEEDVRGYIENALGGSIQDPLAILKYREEVINYVWARLIWSFISYLTGALFIFMTMENYGRKSKSSSARRIPKHDDF